MYLKGEVFASSVQTVRSNTFRNTLYKPSRNTLFIRPHPVFTFYYFKATPPYFSTHDIFLSFFAFLYLFKYYCSFTFLRRRLLPHFVFPFLPPFFNLSFYCWTSALHAQRIHSFFLDALEDSTQCTWFIFFARSFCRSSLLRSFWKYYFILF